MRLLPLALLPLGLVAGCAGHLADYVGPRSGIVSPQLIRYGLDLGQTRCVGERLGATLTPRQLRLFVRSAGAVRQGYYDPARLTIRDLAWVARAVDDGDVRGELDRAVALCGVTTAAAPAPAAGPSPAAGVTILGPGELPPPSGARGETASAAAPRPSAWLNLGAAESGQSIAVDAASIEQEGATRSAWFRLTDPGAAGPSADRFLLHIDCTRRTINARIRERRDAAGAIDQRVDYPDNPLPVEGGTVMQIAWLSMCT